MQRFERHLSAGFRNLTETITQSGIFATASDLYYSAQLNLLALENPVLSSNLEKLEEALNPFKEYLKEDPITLLIKTSELGFAKSAFDRIHGLRTKKGELVITHTSFGPYSISPMAMKDRNIDTQVKGSFKVYKLRFNKNGRLTSVKQASMVNDPVFVNKATWLKDSPHAFLRTIPVTYIMDYYNMDFKGDFFQSIRNIQEISTLLNNRSVEIERFREAERMFMVRAERLLPVKLENLKPYDPILVATATTPFKYKGYHSAKRFTEIKITRGIHALIDREGDYYDLQVNVQEELDYDPNDPFISSKVISVVFSPSDGIVNLGKIDGVQRANFDAELPSDRETALLTEVLEAFQTFTPDP